MATRSLSVSKGKGSLRHNNRDFISKNVDKSRVKDNIIYKQEDLRTAYEKCFGSAIAEYDARQKRSDRKVGGVDGYLEQIRTSKNGEKLFYDTIVQVGNMHDCHVGTADGNKAKKILDAYMKGFEERNPNLYVFNAVMHLDEQTPHLHITYIPKADGYKNGLAVRNSLSKALEQQGIRGANERYNNRTIAWENREKDRLEKEMLKHGFERAEETGLHRKNMSVEEFKLSSDKVTKEIERLEREPIKTAPLLFNKEKVAISREDLDKLQKRAILAETAKRSIGNVTAELRDSQQKFFNEKNEYSVKLQMLGEEYKKLIVKMDEQKHLNERFDAIKSVCEIQEQEVSLLKQENERLRAENRSLREYAAELKDSLNRQIEQAVAPLKEKIGNLEERLHKTCKDLANTMKAVSMLRFDERYKVQTITKKQNRLFTALENSVKKALVRESKHDMALDVEKNMGFSEEIKKEIRILENREQEFIEL